MSTLYILGLGTAGQDKITYEVMDKLLKISPLYLRTDKHLMAEELKVMKIAYESFDAVYEAEETIDAVYSKIGKCLINACMKGDVAYAVPGNPYFYEKSVKIIKDLCSENNIKVIICPGLSAIDSAFKATDISHRIKINIATEMEDYIPDFAADNIFFAVETQHLASELKLILMEYYDPEMRVSFISENGTEVEEHQHIPLYEIDRMGAYNHRCIICVPKDENNNKNIDRLVAITKRLRGEGGCPWDREQTHESLKPHLIEEAYEVVDAIESKDVENLAEELGDLLFQIIFHACLGEEKSKFNFYDVVEGISHKMIYRHPHVFKSKKDISTKEVLNNWEDLKMREKQTSTISQEMERIPTSFTGLMEAQKIQSKASKVGFDWKNPKDALKKVYEEADEVLEELNSKDKNTEALAEELGDLLFAVVNVVRLTNESAEMVLKKANQKFIIRFQEMEKIALKEDNLLQNLSLAELDDLWDRTKSEIH